MAHNSRFWQLGEKQHPHLSILLPWEHTPESEAFPRRYSWTLLHFLKPYIQWCRAFAVANSLVHLEQHGRVFTSGPAPESRVGSRRGTLTL